MPFRITSSFVAKAVAAGGLVALGDWLFWRGNGIGSNLGQFAAAWAVVTVLLAPAAWRDWRSLTAAALALLLAAMLYDNPGPIAWLLFWTALTMAVLLPRLASFEHAGRWALRLGGHVIVSAVGPWQDLFRLRRHVGARPRIPALLPLLPLPLIGGAIFLALFASANPVISDALSNIGAPRFDGVMIGRFIFWMVLLTLVWATLRPRRIPFWFGIEPELPVLDLPGVSIASVTLSLLTFNALFALQNGLDLAFLWSGAPLPEGVTLAEYAHQGAYPLIATALLAGLFVLVTLRPGSATASVPAIRLLVVLWIVQNVFLVASSILRTVDYIEAYSLTGLRIAALIWMALVAVGLVLIVWRMLAGRSAGWLINANAAIALIVLVACTMVDLGSVAAAWNVRHGREAGGEGAEIDLCYLRKLGPSALTSLVRLELQPGLKPEFATRLAWVRHGVLMEALSGQVEGEWIRRNDRRLREVRAMLDGRKLPAPPAEGATGRGCDGAQLPPPPPPVETTFPEALTEPANETEVNAAAPAPANDTEPLPSALPTTALTKEPQR